MYFFTDEIKPAVEVDLPDKNQKANNDSSDLAKTLMEGSQAEIMLAIAEAGEESEIREIKYFTQRSVFTRRILEQMGVGKLEDEIMTFVNQVASIVHEEVTRWEGLCNKNLGNAFLMVWRIGDEEYLKYTED